MNRALVDHFLSLIPETKKRAFEAGKLSSDPKIPFLKFYRWFWQNYGTAMEEEVIGNTAELLNPWQSHKGI